MLELVDQLSSDAWLAGSPPEPQLDDVDAYVPHLQPAVDLQPGRDFAHDAAPQDHPFAIGADPGASAQTTELGLEELERLGAAGGEELEAAGLAMQLVLADDADAGLSPSQPQPPPPPEALPPSPAPAASDPDPHAPAEGAAAGAGQPFTLLLCRKAQEAGAGPGPPEPVDGSQKTGDFAFEVELVLIASREYRLQAARGGRSWAGESVRVRLAYAGGVGAEVAAGLVRFKKGSKNGPAGESALLSFREDGRTAEGFGFRPDIASYQLPRRRPTIFLLSVEGLDGAPSPSSSSTSSSGRRSGRRRRRRRRCVWSQRPAAAAVAAGQGGEAGGGGAGGDGAMRGGGSGSDSEEGTTPETPPRWASSRWPTPATSPRPCAASASPASRRGAQRAPPAPALFLPVQRGPPPRPRQRPRRGSRGPPEGTRDGRAGDDVRGMTGFEREGRRGGGGEGGAAGPGRTSWGPTATTPTSSAASRPAPVRPRPPLHPSPRAARSAAPAAQPSGWQPRIRSFAESSLAPPYRHGSDAAREEATVFFRAALAAVRSCARAAGVKQPVAASDRPSPHVLRACEDLAAALTSPELFDTPLFSTLDGRFRTRAALEDLRLTGSAALARPRPAPPRRRPRRPAQRFSRPRRAQVHVVTAAWLKAILAATAEACAAKEDAELVAWHVWHIFEVCNGAWRWLRAPDLAPVDDVYMTALFGRADLLLEARPASPRRGAGDGDGTGASGRGPGRSRTWRGTRCCARGRQSGAAASSTPSAPAPPRPAAPPRRPRPAAPAPPARSRVVPAAGARNFEAWSVLIRAGLTPSREEATILSDLTWLMVFVPTKWDLCGHFASKMYWFCGDAVEDRWSEAVAITNMGLEASLRGRARMAVRHFERGTELFGALGEGASPGLNCCHEMAGQSCFHIGDFRGAYKAGRLACNTLHAAHGYSYQDTDIWADALRTIREVHSSRHKPGVLSRVFTLNDLAMGVKWSMRVLVRGDVCPKPRLAFLVAHSFYRVRPRPGAPAPAAPAHAPPAPPAQLGCIYHLLEKPAKAAPTSRRPPPTTPPIPCPRPPPPARPRG
eukprot:tig00021579_g22427.t1